MPAKIDMDAVARIMREVGAEAVLPRFRHLAPTEIMPKGVNDFATIADIEAEQALGERLRALLPGSAVVGEEMTERRPELLGMIGAATPTWILDPLDGTHNFAENIACFAMIVALTRAGETVAGWVLDPLSGLMAMAERGAGAFADGRRIKLAPARALAEMRGTIYGRAGRRGLSSRLDMKEPGFVAVKPQRCAGAEYLALARGELDFAVFSRLLPWDHAAGALLHAESGGVNACFDGTPYRPTRHEGGIILAADRKSWNDLADLLVEDRVAG